jgi:putative DNA primase/helicase
MRAKSNIGPDGGGFQYSITEAELPDNPAILATHIDWGSAVEGAAVTTLTKLETVRDKDQLSALEEAEDFLLEQLSDGPVQQTKLFSEAEEQEISKSTLRRAQKKLGIKPKREGFENGHWVWALPSGSAPIEGDQDG